MRTALVLSVVAVLVVTIAAVALVGCLFLFLAYALDVFLLLVLDVLSHSVDILDTETGSKDGDFDFLAEVRVEGNTPFQLESVAEPAHEVVDIVHLVHCQ